MTGDHARPWVRYVRQGKLGFGVVPVVVVVKGRSDSRVIADTLGVVGQIESATSVAKSSNFAKGAMISLSWFISMTWWLY